MSVLSNAPVVFLRLSEAEVGEIDLQLTSAGWTGARTLNYSTVATTSLGPSAGTSFSFHAPRFTFSGQLVRLDDCHPLARIQHDAATAQLNAQLDAYGASNLSSTEWSYYPSDANAPVCSQQDLQTPDPNTAPGPDGSIAVDPGKTCLQVLCSPINTTRATASIFAINTAREARMGLGRAYSFGPIPRNGALIHKNLAATLGLRVGDLTYLSLDGRSNRYVDAIVRDVYDSLESDESSRYNAYLNSTSYNATTTTEAELDDRFPLARGVSNLPGNFRINVPFTVAGILPSSLGKFAASETTAMLVEYNDLIQTLGRAMSTNMTGVSILRPHIRTLDLQDYASEINVNLPDPRIEPYLSSDFDTIQKNVLDYTAKVVYRIGFNQIDADEPIVESLRASRFFALFLGLITNIILIMLTGLAVLLLYSLLMVNVETRTFEVGTMRMLGLTKAGVVQLFLIQAFLYAIPAYIFGMIVSQVAFWLLAQVFEDATDVAISPYLSLGGILLATGLGLAVPVVAALAPIKTALDVSLVSALQVNRSKQTAVKVTLERSEDGAFSWPMIVTGSVIAGFGFVVYYLLPLALLSFNLTLLLNIFFALLIGMLLGLALLALNFQHIIERSMVFLLLQWWEARAVTSMVVKNLVSHRLRNRKTTLMYSVSLAVIVFISVSFSLQIATFVYAARRSTGARMVVDTPSWDRLDELEDILRGSPIVRDWAFSSLDLKEFKSNMVENVVSNVGRIFKSETDFFAVSPNFYDVVFDGFLSTGAEREGYKTQSLSYMLHTPLGSSSALLATTFREALELRSLDETWTLESKFEPPSGGEATYFLQMQTMAFVDSSPVFRFSKFPSVGGLDAVVSFPTLRRLMEELGGDEASSVALTDIPIASVYLSISEDVGDGELDTLLSSLRNFAVTDLRSDEDALADAETVLSFFFIFSTSISMLVSYFSLTSSTASNIFESSKEIAILRSMGGTKWQLRRIYVWESFILVMSSAGTGIGIGTAVSYTMVLQRILFSQLPIPFELPYDILIAVLIVAMISAVVSALFPINRLLRKEIVGIMRAS